MAPSLHVAPLRDLSATEVHDLFRLRCDVFVVEQQCAYPELDGVDAREDTVHVVARDAGRVVGTARVFPLDSVAGPASCIGRFVVAPSHRGTGLAERIMAAALNEARARWPERDILIAAQLALAEYYEQRYGYAREDEPFDDAGILHTWMRLPAR
ncbi:GNAT family N-acetyltransferase [Corynebacterium uterequi]|uniref:Putative acyltransferase n=1 Tax=Corynebacterium uterequi TaxID=1072256 RepID=A0A0G3HIZ3_9CORY|nr:GNAT family N-acetyltransferase [Corynebacterium uterequi]AKK11918.1 putative acyltransferase [Corynebacterium uterequi]